MRSKRVKANSSIKIKEGDTVTLCSGAVVSNIKRLSKTGHRWVGTLEKRYETTRPEQVPDTRPLGCRTMFNDAAATEVH